MARNESNTTAFIAPGRRPGAALQPPGQRLPSAPRGAGPSALALLHRRWGRGAVTATADGGFDRIRYRQHDASVFLYAFDLIELNGDDLRREQIEARKAELANLMRNLASALRSRRRRWVHSHGER
jgi:hypothetical protein